MLRIDTADSPTMERKKPLMIGLTGALVLVSLLIDLANIAGQYDLISSPERNFLLAGKVIKVSVLLWVIWLLKIPKITAPAIMLIVIMIFQSFGYGLVRGLIDLGQFGDFLTATAFNVFAAVAVAFMWMIVGSHLLLNTKAAEDFNGYAPVLGISALIVSAFELVFFLETPKYIGYSCMCLGFLGLLMSLYTGRLKLSYLSRSRFFTITLGVPAVIYSAPFAYVFLKLSFGIGMAIYNDSELHESTKLAAAPLDQINTWESFIRESTPGYQSVSVQRLFSDVWILPDGRQQAVSSEGVFGRDSKQSQWELVYKPQGQYTPGKIVFNQNGNRGVIDLDYGHVALTEDGGQNWHEPDLFEIFERHAGRPFGEKFSDDYSRVYIDPETGLGSFVMGCYFFTTNTFATEWQMDKIESDAGKSMCLADSPFALDEQKGLALTDNLMGKRTLYTLSDSGEWSERCLLDVEFFNLSELPACDEDNELSDAQLAYLEKVNSQQDSIHVLSEVIDQIIASELTNNELIQSAVRTSGSNQWLAGEGFLIYVNANGSFTIDHRVPYLYQIYPLNAEKALASAGSFLFETEDSGVTWKRVYQDQEYIEVLGQAAESSDVYYLAGNAIVRWSGNSHTPLHDLDESEAGKLTVSRSGTALLLETSDESYLYSSDAGITWDKYVYPLPPAQLNEYDYMETPHIVSFDCLLEYPARECVVLYDNGEVYRWPPDEPGSLKTLQSVELTASGFSSGDLSVLNAQPAYLYLPGDETSQLRVFNDEEWEIIRLPRKYDYFPHTAYTPDRKKSVVWTDDEMLLLIEPTGEHQLFGFGDDSDIRSTCSDDTGSVFLVAGDNRLAITHNSGKSWYTNHKEAEYSTACGHNKNSLWLSGSSLAVYKQTDQRL